MQPCHRTVKHSSSVNDYPFQVWYEDGWGARHPSEFVPENGTNTGFKHWFTILIPQRTKPLSAAKSENHPKSSTPMWGSNAICVEEGVDGEERVFYVQAGNDGNDGNDDGWWRMMTDVVERNDGTSWTDVDRRGDLQHATTRSRQVTNEATETLEAEGKAEMVWVPGARRGKERQGDKHKDKVNQKTLQEIQRKFFCSALYSSYSSCLWFISVHVPVIHVHCLHPFNLDCVLVLQHSTIQLVQKCFKIQTLFCSLEIAEREISRGDFCRLHFVGWFAWGWEIWEGPLSTLWCADSTVSTVCAPDKLFRDGSIRQAPRHLPLGCLLDQEKARNLQKPKAVLQGKNPRRMQYRQYEFEYRSDIMRWKAESIYVICARCARKNANSTPLHQSRGILRSLQITSDHFRSLQMFFFFRKEFWSARYKEKSVENELSGRLPEAQQKLSKETKRNLETEKRFNV